MPRITLTEEGAIGVIPPVLILLMLTGCASVTSGTQQSVLVETTPKGASCTLGNDKGSWEVSDTPRSATVSRSSSALSVTCEKGDRLGVATVQSTTKAAAFGNILLGGIVGAAVDMSSGAAYDYPPSVLVTLSDRP